MRKEEDFKDWVELKPYKPTQFDKYCDALAEKGDNNAKILLDFIKAMAREEGENEEKTDTIA